MNVGGFLRSENDDKQVIMIFILNCYSTKWVFGSSHKEHPTRQEQSNIMASQQVRVQAPRRHECVPGQIPFTVISVLQESFPMSLVAWQKYFPVSPLSAFRMVR